MGAHIRHPRGRAALAIDEVPHLFELRAKLWDSFWTDGGLGRQSGVSGAYCMPALLGFRTVAIVSLFFLACCESVHDLPEIPPEYPTEDTGKITDHRGGTHHRTMVEGQIWYQTYGSELLVLDAHDGSELYRIEPIAFGESGALVDMAILDKRMYVVSSGDAVIELDLEDQRRPAVRQIRPASDLGIRPRSVAVIDRDVWISGEGGVRRWNTEGPVQEFGEGSVRVGRVVPTEHGPAVPVGRRVHAVEDGAFLGAATMLEPLPPAAGIPGGLLFVLQGDSGASVGVMGGDVRQYDDFAMRGQVHGVRFADGRIWAFTDVEIATAELRPTGKLGPVEWISIKGARDLDGAGPNYYAVGGTFGRSLYRFRSDDAGEADSFFAVTREPGRLDAAIDNGRRVMTGSIEGTWVYTIGDSIELTNQTIARDVAPSDFAAANWGDVRTVKGGSALVLHLGSEDFEWSPPNGALINTVVVMGRRVWVGHQEGLSLIRINGPEDATERDFFSLAPPPPFEVAANLRISSGVTHVLPVRVGDQVVWVSPNGGIGVAKVERQRLAGWEPNFSILN